MLADGGLMSMIGFGMTWKFCVFVTVHTPTCPTRVVVKTVVTNGEEPVGDKIMFGPFGLNTVNPAPESKVKFGAPEGVTVMLLRDPLNLLKHMPWLLSDIDKSGGGCT
jgi:hypothetical protein